VSTATLVAAVALLGAGVLGLVHARTRRVLARLEERMRVLEQVVRADLEPGVAAARADAHTAVAAARDAAIAAGARPAPPRLLLEPVTGPVVRAVAFGASARRVLTPRRKQRSA
jgi:hypothetical protein